MARVYLMDVSLPFGEEETERLAARLAGGLSSGRREKIAGLRFQQDRLLSLGAGLLMDMGLKEYGLRERDEAIAYGGNRKPYLAGHPDIHFNLSHSGTMAMAAFSDHEIGCDVERVRKIGMGVAERFFCPEERSMLAAAGSENERLELFFRIWTMKESYMKITGEGMRMALDAFCVHPGQPSWAEKDARPVPYLFREFEVPGYRASVCMEQEPVFYSFQKLQDVV